MGTRIIYFPFRKTMGTRIIELAGLGVLPSAVLLVEES